MKPSLVYFALTLTALGGRLTAGQDTLLYDVDIAARDAIDDDVWARDFTDDDIEARRFVDDEFEARDFDEEEIMTRDMDILTDIPEEEVWLLARKKDPPIIIPNQASVTELWLKGHYNPGQPFCTQLGVYQYGVKNGVKGVHVVDDCRKRTLFGALQGQCVYKTPPAGEPECQYPYRPKKEKSKTM